jgi:hypothetical protein
LQPFKEGKTMSIPQVISDAFDFKQISLLLLDPTNQGMKTREEISRYAAHAKTIAGIAMAIFALCCVGNLAIGAGAECVASAIIAFACKEIFVIAGNVSSTFNHNSGVLGNLTGGVLGNIGSRAASALSPKKFVDSIFANTWGVGPVFSASLIQGYEDSLTRTSET